MDTYLSLHIQFLKDLSGKLRKDTDRDKTILLGQHRQQPIQKIGLDRIQDAFGLVKPFRNLDSAAMSSADSNDGVRTSEYLNIILRGPLTDPEMICKTLICSVSLLAEIFPHRLSALVGTHDLTPSPLGLILL